MKIVSGRGKSLFAESGSNGAYFLEKKNDHEWILDIFPAQCFLSDPGRGKTYRFMANRYVNCLKEPPVSQLSERKVDFKLNALELISCEEAANGKTIPVASDGSILVAPGTYLLKVK